MAKLILFNKPYRVLCQFSPHENKTTLAEFIKIKDVYPAGRLDYDSEGLLLLTDDGKLQNKLSSPKFAKGKVYWVQVEGKPDEKNLRPFFEGMQLKDGKTKPAKCKTIPEPENLWPRNPPIRERKNIPTTWLEITLTEGKNRQVRRMCAAIGFPVLRLIRTKVDSYALNSLSPGEILKITI